MESRQDGGVSDAAVNDKELRLTVVTKDNTMPDVKHLKCADLKIELGRRKLKTTGSKRELVQRLEAALLIDNARDNDVQSDNDTDESEDEDSNIMRYKSEYAKPMFTFRDVDESLETFSGDDGKNVVKWISNFEDMAEMCNWNGMQKIIYAKRLLRGSARMYVNYEQCTKSWQALKEALCAEFAPKLNSRKNHKQLSMEVKNQNETYQEYMYQMIEISSQITIEDESVIQ
ncbi:uncharacterized protein LOC111631907 [Centruroides sculpturatus]|uniref:uncharacterized protein LOC111631907 n=1 Tax=Centruroides sculpturatus TaxID=218467 RepID=UPI000C6CA57F|nr:uncharacterized protein LOC111631907 [Centruroides sculpturatus]